MTDREPFREHRGPARQSSELVKPSGAANAAPGRLATAPATSATNGTEAPLPAKKTPPLKGRRVTTQLVTLSSAAILSVYAAGYLRTQPAEALIVAREATAASLASPGAPNASPPTPSVTPRSTPVTTSPASAQPGGLGVTPGPSTPSGFSASAQPGGNDDSRVPWWLQPGNGFGGATAVGGIGDDGGDARSGRGSTSAATPGRVARGGPSSAGAAGPNPGRPSVGSLGSAGSSATPTPVPPATATPVPSVPPTTAPVARPTAVPTVARSPYKDGTFVGNGYSRHGGVTARVVIQGGKIVSADIADCTTRYPCDAIAPLPPEVLTSQSARIDYVSGATDSSMAYMGAVQDALSQASG